MMVSKTDPFALRRWNLCVSFLAALAFLGTTSVPAASEGVRLHMAGYGVEYEAEVSMGRYDYKPSDTIEARIELEIHGGKTLERCLQQAGRVYCVLQGERRYDKEGRFRQRNNVFCSTTLTPSGLAVEHYENRPYFSCLNGAPFFPEGTVDGIYGSDLEMLTTLPAEKLERTSKGWRATITVRGKIPESLAEGFYRMTFHLLTEWKGRIIRVVDLANVEEGFDLNFTDTGLSIMELPLYVQRFLFPENYLPNVRIGNPDPPRCIWTLLGTAEKNGLKGVIAEEDRETFQFSFRRQIPTRLILSPGLYNLEPDFPEFKIGSLARDLNVSMLMPEQLRSFYRYPSGHLSVVVIDPKGQEHHLGSSVFTRTSGTGAATDRSPLTFDFSSYGDYTILVDGWIEDLVGHRYTGGGTYRLTVAETLTFSTAVKPGTPFLVGEGFPISMSVNPPVPADIRTEITFYPFSRREDRMVKVIQGKASRYGFYEETNKANRFLFSSPGEYRSRVSATFRSPNGVLWEGCEDSASVVAPKDSIVRVHGHKLAEMNRYGAFGFHPRGPALQEGSMSITFRDYANCFRLPMPYFSGDIAYLASTMDGGNSFTSILSWEDTTGGRLKSTFLRALSLTGDFAKEGQTHGSESARSKMMRLNQRLDYPVVDPEAEGSMLPFLFLSQDRRSPFSFPESSSLEGYFYLSAVRPGFIPQFTVSDSMIFEPYWETSPNRFGGQINVGQNGDLPGDMYRFLGGAVIRDRGSGQAYYGIYSSVGIVIPPGSWSNRVSAPGVEPLMEMNGRNHFLFLGLEAAQIHETGESFALAGTVLPTVQADVEFTVIAPDGDTQHFRGKANAIGRCMVGRVQCTLPGVYRQKVRIRYNGREGDVLGSGDGVYNNYVVDHDPTPLLRLTSPAGPSWIEGDEDLRLRFEVAPEIRNPKITYTVLMPGIVMDEGEIHPAGHRFDHVFSPRAAALQFSSYDLTDYVSGTKKLMDTVVFVFFLEGKTTQNETRFDVKKVVLRGHRFLPGMPEKQPIHPE